MTPTSVFYNDNCSYAVDWLRNLTSAGHLPAGVVDGRDIERITPDAVKGFKECHFFAGIGGWPLALRLAGWPLSRPVWTGSCPCQPFSTAGKRKGTADSRHLWPEFLRLIEECRPPTVFGEQVASKLGRKWLARVRFDLEALGYGVGAADLCGPCVGAPHIRQRLYWVADTDSERPIEQHVRLPRPEAAGRGASRVLETGRGGGTGRQCGQHADTGDCRRLGGLGQPHGPREAPLPEVPAGAGVERAGGPGFWDAYDLVYCRDDKVRRVEPGTFPLAHRVPNSVGRLRAYGNAIVPQVAAMFVRAYLGQ